MRLAVGRLGVSTSARALLSVLPVLAVVIHEFAHALAALPFARRVDVTVDGVESAASIAWRGDAPVLAVRVAHLAPTLVGLGVACVVVALFGMPSPAWVAFAVARPLDAAVALIVGLNWTILTYPSREDRRPFGR